MSSTLSPNMSLILPGVGTEPGPTWAQDLNNSLTILDAHDHTQGSGVLITPLAININTALTFNNQLATNLQAVNFTLQSADASSQSLYVKLGGESVPGPYADLWYNDGSNAPIQLTSGGMVNATIASIPGESYSGGTFTWKQTQDSLPTTPANFDIGSVTIRPNTAATTNGVTLSPPSAISSAYTILLPTLPSSQNLLSLDNSGNMKNVAPDNSTIVIAANVLKVPAGGITGTQIASATIHGSNIAAATVTGSNIASNTVTGGFSGNLALATVTGGASGNIANGTITATEVSSSFIASNTYTPTLASFSNVSSAGASSAWNYLRVGNMVTVSGALDVTVASTTTAWSVTATVPVAPQNNFSDVGSAGGMNSSLSPSTTQGFVPGPIFANAGSKVVNIRGGQPGSGNPTSFIVSICFMYELF